MNCIAHSFSQYSHAVKFLAIYRNPGTEDFHVESYDPSPSGRPINAHPLSSAEAQTLGRVLTKVDKPTHFLLPESLLPDAVLHLSSVDGGTVIWFTPAERREIYFTESLGIPSGKAWLPPLLWMATRKSLHIFALRTASKPGIEARLYHAPFFNVDERGQVCMGTVNVKIDEHASLETFIRKWQDYFYNSYFSHTNVNRSPVTVNIVKCWKELVNTEERFPAAVLRKHSLTLKDLL